MAEESQNKQAKKTRRYVHIKDNTLASAVLVAMKPKEPKKEYVDPEQDPGCDGHGDC